MSTGGNSEQADSKGVVRGSHKCRGLSGSICAGRAAEAAGGWSRGQEEVNCGWKAAGQSWKHQSSARESAETFYQKAI